MKHNYVSVSSLFAQPGRYTVPLFQRPYVWTEDEQWKPLWEDVRRVAEDVNSAREILRSHFLGSVVLELQHTPAGHLASREIIDGQQRLTTLQIFLKAAADATAAQGASLASGQLTDLVENRHVPADDPNGRFKVWPTEVDQLAYVAVMDAKDGDIPNKFRDHLFAAAYSYFRRSIIAWLGTVQSDANSRATALSTALHQQVKLMALDIDPGEDGQVIFETLNARGTPLLPIDLVKNWLLREARRQRANVGKLYASHWRETFDIQIEYWREEIGRGHAQRPRADLFLQNYLTMRLREEIASDRLYYHFLDDIERHKNDAISSRIADVERYAKIFREIEQPDEDTELGRRYARLKELDFLTMYPFLMSVRAIADDAQLIPILEIVESFLVRRLICGLNTRSYGTLFLDLMNAVVTSNQKMQPMDRVIAFLLSSNTEAARWPDNAELKKAWLGRPVYEKLGRPRVRFILSALEEHMRNGDGLTEPFVLPARLEIEHVMPQSWEANWPLPKGEKLDGKVAEHRREIIHTIGNLTLLTKKLNATLSNAAWSSDVDGVPCKRKTIKKFSITMLSKDVVDEARWDEDSIAERGKLLFHHACKIWPIVGAK